MKGHKKAPMNEKDYPDWVQARKARGTTVKKVGGNYYLYKHMSKRVPEAALGG